MSLFIFAFSGYVRDCYIALSIHDSSADPKLSSRGQQRRHYLLRKTKFRKNGGNAGTFHSCILVAYNCFITTDVEHIKFCLQWSQIESKSTCEMLWFKY